MSDANEFVLVPKAALLWLNGEGPDHEGLHFGESADSEERPGRGRFWWRKRFRAMLEATPIPTPTEDREEVARAIWSEQIGIQIDNFHGLHPETKQKFFALAAAAISTLQALGWGKK